MRLSSNEQLGNIDLGVYRGSDMRDRTTVLPRFGVISYDQSNGWRQVIRLPLMERNEQHHGCLKETAGDHTKKETGEIRRELKSGGEGDSGTDDRLPNWSL